MRPATSATPFLLSAALAFPLLLSASAHADDFDGPPVVVERGEELRLLNGVLHDMEELERDSGEHGERWEREKREHLFQEMREIRERLSHLRDQLSLAPIARGEIPPPPPPPPPTPRAMGDEEYQRALRSLSEVQYTPRKYEVMSDLSRLNWFTVDEVVGLMSQLNWQNDRVRFAGMCYPHTVDREHWGRVYEALQGDPDRDELRRLTGDYRR